MPNFLSRLLTPPTLADPEQTSVVRQLYNILLLGVPIAFSFIIFDADIRAQQSRFSDWIAAGSGCILLVLLFFLRRGYVRTVSIMTILTAFGAIMLASFSNIGIRNPAMVLLSLLLVLCSALLGSRFTIGFALLCGVMATVLYLREINGRFYPQAPVPDSDYLFIVLILIGVTTMILHFTVNQIVQSAQQIRQQATELQQQNQRLAQIQATLEARTRQLSKLNTDLQLEMSERARTEAVLRQKQKLESIGLLAGGIAHDFNNLLFSILSQSDLAVRRLHDKAKARDHIEKAMQATHQAADLTRQLLAYAGKTRFQVEAVDLNQLITANHGLLETVIQRNSRLHCQLQPQIPAVAADRGQLQQVLLNLVINASEAITNDRGQIVLKTSTVNLTVAPDPTTFVGTPPAPGNYVCLEVSDNGLGMEPAVLEKIFDPFFSTKARGHGLGLSVVLGVVQALQGGLQVQSHPHQGSTFGVYLPASLEQPATVKPPIALAKQTAVHQLVLVIDDEDPVREAVAEMLNSVGYRTLVAANGAEGLTLFGQHPNEINAVLLDVVMPGMNGVETLQKLRTMHSTVQVILSSGYTDTALPDSVLQQSATSFLPKPYTLEQLVQAMKSLS